MPIFDLLLKRRLARGRDIVAGAEAIQLFRPRHTHRSFQPSSTGRAKSRWSVPNIPAAFEKIDYFGFVLSSSDGFSIDNRTLINWRQLP